MIKIKPEKIKALEERIKTLKISDKDIQEKFIRSRGKGGQNVNKNSTCVYLKHLPTSLEVKYDKDRSQYINRFMAKRLLVEKLEAMITGNKTEKDKKIDKLRKQKAKRKKRSIKKNNKIDK